MLGNIVTLSLQCRLINQRKQVNMEALFVDNPSRINRKSLIGIYDELSPVLFNYAYRMLGERDLAEDCVSETFSRFLSAVRNGRGPSENVKAYLYRIAHNWITDYYRNRHREALELNEDILISPGNSLTQDFINKQEKIRLREALLRLHPDHRLVLELRFIEEWSHEEVAKALGKSAQATRALQYRAIESLRRILMENGRDLDDSHQ